MQRFIETLLANAKLILFVLIIMILALCGNPTLNNDAYDSGNGYPQIVVRNLHLCTLNDGQWIPVTEFSDQENQSVCGSVVSESGLIYLTLIIQEESNIFGPEFTDAGEFKNGFFSFSISPRLSNGAYTAKILYARKTLAEMRFSVLGK